MRKIQRGKRRGLIVGGAVLGLLALLAPVLALGGPLAVQLGIRPVCLQGDWPHFRVVSCPGPTTAAPAATPWPLPTPSRQVPMPTARLEPSPSPESNPSPKPAAGTTAPVGQIAAGLQKLAEQGRFSGAVLIARDGEPVLEQAYGLADRAVGLPNRVDTRFNLGSMDKMFTAIATLQLVEQGKLSLQGTIADYVPDYPNQEVASAVADR